MNDFNFTEIMNAAMKEMVEKYILAKLEEMITARLDKIASDVDIHTALLSNPNVQAVLTGVPINTLEEQDTVTANKLHTLTMRLDMAYKEIDRLQRVLGVESVESGCEVFIGRDVLTRLEDVQDTLNESTINRMIDDAVEVALEDSTKVGRVVSRMVEREMDNQDFEQMVKDNFDITDYEDEIREIAGLDGGDFESRVREVVRDMSFSVSAD